MHGFYTVTADGGPSCLARQSAVNELLGNGFKKRKAGKKKKKEKEKEKEKENGASANNAVLLAAASAAATAGVFVVDGGKLLACLRVHKKVVSNLPQRSL